MLTVGHGRLNSEALGDVLRTALLDAVVDVRRFPSSRSNPDVGRESLERWLPDLGITYRWEQRLGGRRQQPRDEPVLDTWWTVPAFRAYAAHTRTPGFREAFDQVLDDATGRRIVLMCSESLWWRCHRRLIADVAVLGHGVAVDHLYPNGRLDAHRPAPGARLGDDGLVVWDGCA